MMMVFIIMLFFDLWQLLRLIIYLAMGDCIKFPVASSE